MFCDKKAPRELLGVEGAFVTEAACRRRESAPMGFFNMLYKESLMSKSALRGSLSGEKSLPLKRPATGGDVEGEADRGG